MCVRGRADTTHQVGHIPRELLQTSEGSFGMRLDSEQHKICNERVAQLHCYGMKSNKSASIILSTEA